MKRASHTFACGAKCRASWMKRVPRRPTRSPHESHLVQSGSFADVAGSANFSLGISQRVGATACAHGSPLRRQLAAERLHLAARGARAGSDNYGCDACDLHAIHVDPPVAEANCRVARAADCVRSRGLLLVRQSFDREIQFECTEGKFSVVGCQFSVSEIWIHPGRELRTKN